MYSTASNILHQLILVGAVIKGIHGISENIIALNKQYNITHQINATSDNDRNMTEIELNLDSVIKIHFNLDEMKITPYLRDEIFEHYVQHNITVQDLIDLWNLRDYELKDLLKILEIPEVFLDLNSLQRLLAISKLTFNEYYADMRKHINNTQLIEALQILEIDVANFSTAITFGTENQVYEVLSRGRFSWGKFEEVYNRTGLYIPTLTKNLVLTQVATRNLTSLLTDIQSFPMVNRNMYRNLWEKMNITTYNIYRVVHLRRIVDSLHDFLTKNVTLGVAVSKNEIILHKEIYTNVEEVKDIMRISGESSLSHKLYENLTFYDKKMRNSIFLWSNASIVPNIEIMDRVNDKSNSSCFYIDDDMTPKNVTLISTIQYNSTVAVDEGAHFNFGNPLICDEKLLGLAVHDMMDENIFIFDTVAESSEEHNNGVQNKRPPFHLISFIVVSPFLLFLK